MTDLLLKDEVYAIVGAAIEVHRELGCGFLEAVYQEAMEWEALERGILIEPQKRLSIRYKDRILKKEYVADIICYGQIIVEIKAAEKLMDRDEAQLINYLNATGLRVGVLINFGAHGKLEWRRLVN